MSTTVNKMLTLCLIQSYSLKRCIYQASATNVFLGNSETTTGVVLWKKLPLKISQYSQESCRPATLLKTDSNTGVFLWILQNF